MKTDEIKVTSQGGGFSLALDETRRVSIYCGLKGKDALHLTLFTEEILSLVRMFSDDIEAFFQIECDAKHIDLHLSAKAFLDKKKRAQLISAATSQKNEAANSFLGKIRNAFEQALAADYEYSEMPFDLQTDIFGRLAEEPDWGEYECSILRKLADDVKVSIRGDKVDLTVRMAYTS